jgi:hypothetical protein
MLLSGPAQAQGFRVNAWKAKGLVNASSVNAFLVDSFGLLRSSYGVTQHVSVGINESDIVGVDVGYEFWPGLVLGVRVGRLTLFQGHVTGRAVDPSTGRTGEFRLSLDSTVVPYLVGGTLLLAGGERWNFVGTLYLGYAYGEADYSQSAVLGGSASELSLPLQGSGIADDFGFEYHYKVLPSLAVGFSLHLLNTRITDMRTTTDVPDIGVTAGEPLRDRLNRVVSFDYNTIALGAGINLFF